MTFMEAAAFQWVNPKAWMMAVTGDGHLYQPKAPVVSVLLVALAFTLVNFPGVSIWPIRHGHAGGFLADPVRLKMVQHRHGAVAGGQPVADAEMIVCRFYVQAQAARAGRGSRPDMSAV